MSGEKAGERPQRMRPVTDEAIFKASKEVVVKFIEVGRLTPAGFEQAFERIYRSMRRAVRDDDA